MPKVSKESARKQDHGPVVDHEAELAGYCVSFVEFRQDVDGTALLRGAKDDRCQCPHWGYVLKGSMTLRFPDREEVYQAGEAYYAPAGHVPVKHAPGTEIVQFSPTDELRKTQAVMFQNMKAMSRG